MEHRTVSLRCGPNRYEVTVPEGVRFQYAALRPAHRPEDPAAAVRAALDHPVGAPPIEQVVRPGQKVCIISDDNTRMTPVPLILRELLPRIEGAGVPRENIFIVMALGSHRYMTQEEMVSKLGQDIFDRYRVYNSEFENPDQLVQVGSSELGTPIRVFAPAMEADVRIGIGSVVPHGCMGWSGGAKILYPGITAADIVSEFHVMQGLRNEVLLGMVEAPTRLAVEKWTEQIGLDYIVNTVLDENMQLCHVSAGHYVQAQRQAVSHARQIYGIPLRQRPDVVLTCAYPIHMDFWQCGKAAYGPASVLPQGGELLLLAACSEGVGPHPKILDYMGMDQGQQELERRVQTRQTGEDLLTMAVGVSMGRVARQCRMTLISDGMTQAQCAQAGMWHRAESQLQQALEEALARRTDPFLLILSEGGEAVPIWETSA